MAGNVAFFVVVGVAALFVVALVVFAVLDRREGRKVAAQDGWSYQPTVANAPAPVPPAPRNARRVRYSHVVTAADGAKVFRRTYSERRWNGEPDDHQRPRVSRVFVHLPDTAVRPCVVTWAPADGLEFESGDEHVERVLSSAEFLEALTASGGEQMIRLDVGPAGMLLETTRGAAVKHMAETLEWGRSVERLLATAERDAAG